jgi:hypothetical protein
MRGPRARNPSRRSQAYWPVFDGDHVLGKCRVPTLSDRICQRSGLSVQNIFPALPTGRVVPIRQFLGRDASFGPDDLKAMGEAFDAARAKFNLVDLKNPLTA